MDWKWPRSLVLPTALGCGPECCGDGWHGMGILWAPAAPLGDKAARAWWALDVLDLLKLC